MIAPVGMFHRVFEINSLCLFVNLMLATVLHFRLTYRVAQLKWYQVTN